VRAAPFGDDWNCGIKLGDGAWPGPGSPNPLFAADLQPVCAPRLATQLKTPPAISGDRGLLRVAHAARRLGRYG